MTFQSLIVTCLHWLLIWLGLGHMWNTQTEKKMIRITRIMITKAIQTTKIKAFCMVRNFRVLAACQKEKESWMWLNFSWRNNTLKVSFKKCYVFWYLGVGINHFTLTDHNKPSSPGVSLFNIKTPLETYLLVWLSLAYINPASNGKKKLFQTNELYPDLWEVSTV